MPRKQEITLAPYEPKKGDIVRSNSPMWLLKHRLFTVVGPNTWEGYFILKEGEVEYPVVHKECLILVKRP